MNMKTWSFVVPFVALLVATLTPHAHAQSGAAAEALFQEGTSAAEEGDYQLACEKFGASHKLDPAAGTLLNIADCSERQGLIATAWETYLEAAEKFQKGDARIAYAREHAQALEARLPRVRLMLDSPPSDTKIYRGAQQIPLAALGTPLPVDPGQQTYRVESPGHQPAESSVTTAEGETQTLALTLGAPLVPPAPPVTQTTSEPAPYLEEEPRKSSSPRKTWGWVSLGVGVAGLAAGSITGLMVIDKKNIVERDCQDDYCRTSEGPSAASSGATLSIVSTVSFAVGALATGTGLYLLLSGTHDKPSAILRTTPTFAGGLLSLEGTL